MSGDISLTGNMTVLPLFMAGFYFGLFGSFTSTAEVGATVVTCNPQVPAACVVALENPGSSSTAVGGCTIQDQYGNSTVGTVFPNDPTVPAGGSVQVACTLPPTTSAGPTGSPALGTIDLSNGASVPFFGTWNSSAVVSTSTTTSAGTSTSAGSTTTNMSLSLPQSYLDLFSVFSNVTSSLQGYTYTMSYASGIWEASETLQYAQNLNLDQAMPLFAQYAANQSAPSYITQFLNSTRIDISSFSTNMSEIQNASGEFDTNISVADVTIYPQIVKSGGMFNESGLFRALGTVLTNVTVAGGTNADGSVSIVVPAGVPSPTSSTADSKTWTDTNMSLLAGLEFSVGQASTTSTTSAASTAATTSHSTTTSSTSTTGGGGIPEFSVLLSVALLVAVIIAASYVISRRRVRIGKQPPD